MRRALLMMLFATVLLASGIGTATAEPQKNQIEVTVSCDNDQEYTLVFNAMSKTGQVSGSMSNVVVKSGTVTFKPTDGTQPITDEIGGQGNKKGLQSDLIACDGETERIVIEGLGEVTAVFAFEGFVTPRGK